MNIFVNNYSSSKSHCIIQFYIKQSFTYFYTQVYLFRYSDLMGTRFTCIADIAIGYCFFPFHSVSWPFRAALLIVYNISISQRSVVFSHAAGRQVTARRTVPTYNTQLLPISSSTTPLNVCTRACIAVGRRKNTVISVHFFLHDSNYCEQRTSCHARINYNGRRLQDLKRPDLSKCLHKAGLRLRCCSVPWTLNFLNNWLKSVEFLFGELRFEKKRDSKSFKSVKETLCTSRSDINFNIRYEYEQNIVKMIVSKKK